MVKLIELNNYLDKLLALDSISKDASNNGLQIEGDGEVRKAIFGVDACQTLFQKAVDKKAEFIFVHHGLSWGDNFKYLSGLTAERLRSLFTNKISLYAAHLPLDAHSEIGHNVCLARMIGLTETSMFAKYADVEIGVKGELPVPQSPREIMALYQKKLGTEDKFEIFGETNCEIRKIGIISGGAGSDGVLDAATEKIDCLITGEVGHSSYHLIKETGLTVIALGHYNSEQPGVLAVMENVQKNFEIDCEFIRLPTGL